MSAVKNILPEYKLEAERYMLELGFEPKRAEKILEKIELHLELLERWNRIHNLTALAGRDKMFLKLAMDSLLFLELKKQQVADFEKVSYIADFGSGTGFPGIVIALLFSEAKVSLIESRKKKSAFLKYVVAELNIDNVEVISERAESVAEEIKKGARKSFDVVISKAAAKFFNLVNLAYPLLNQGGWLAVWNNKKNADNILMLAEKEGIFKNWNLKIVTPKVKGKAFSNLDTVFVLLNKRSEEMLSGDHCHS